MGMVPLARELYPLEVEVHRKEDCISYNDCLKEAAMKKYISFSCKKCEDYEKNPEPQHCYAMSDAVAEYSYPSYPYGGNLREFSNKLTAKMRELGFKLWGDRD